MRTVLMKTGQHESLVRKSPGHVERQSKQVGTRDNGVKVIAPLTRHFQETGGMKRVSQILLLHRWGDWSLGLEDGETDSRCRGRSWTSSRKR